MSKPNEIAQFIQWANEEPDDGWQTWYFDGAADFVRWAGEEAASSHLRERVVSAHEPMEMFAF
jgi:hypothetical protein